MRLTVKSGGRMEPHQIDKATESCMDALVLDLNGYKTFEGCTTSEKLAYISVVIDFANVNSGTKVLAQEEKEIEHFTNFLSEELSEYDGIVERKPSVMMLTARLGGMF